MTNLIQLVIATIFTLYLVMVCLLLLGWIKAQRASAKKSGKSGQQQPAFVSVVIAVRNEATSLPSLVSDLKQQRGPNFEVIIVDDASEDDTIQKALQSIDLDPRFSVIHSGGSGKKAALTRGVQRARGSIILTTDADCRIGPGWIASMTQGFTDPAAMLLFGPVRIEGTTLFSKLQSLEFATLIGTAFATAALSKPTMCNGANLSYRKEAFDRVGGYTSDIGIPSGDDEFLMRKLVKAYPDPVRYCNAGEAIVTTLPSGDVKTFFHQRIRWAGKWKYNESPTSLLLAAFVFSFHLVVVALPWLAVTGLITVVTAFLALAAKASIELIFIRALDKKLRISWSWIAFLGLQVVYSYYVVLVAVSSQFIFFDWKGRRLKSFMAKSPTISRREDLSLPNNP